MTSLRRAAEAFASAENRAIDPTTWREGAEAATFSLVGGRWIYSVSTEGVDVIGELSVDDQLAKQAARERN